MKKQCNVCGIIDNINVINRHHGENCKAVMVTPQDRNKLPWSRPERSTWGDLYATAVYGNRRLRAKDNDIIFNRLRRT